MDFFYDGQIRRYVTQFMRVFIGFKYKAGNGDEISVPVSYGDMARQVAAIIKENSENEVVTKTFKGPDGTIVSKEVELFTWEKLDYVDKVKAAFGL